MKLPFTSDGGYGAGPAIGVVVLSTDETLEPELHQITAQTGVSLYHSRIPFDPCVTPETLARMETVLPASLALFPRHAKYG
ncbi:MAG: Asp/Glu racemase, partial [Amylibacter sp.]